MTTPTPTLQTTLPTTLPKTLDVVQTRGPAIETRHAIHAVLVRADGALLDRIGEPTRTTWRSGAKPLQLEVSARRVGRKLADLTDADLALGAASHSGQPGHTERVLALLKRFELTEDALYCGAHWPVHEPSARALAAAGGEASAVHNNCSGKHALMAIAVRHSQWPPDYRPMEHPLQQAIRDNIETRAGESVAVAVDGCGVPCWIVSLAGMARCYAQLSVDDHLLGRIGLAMQRQPWFTSGTDRFEAIAMERATGPLVAKVGAAGLICATVLGRGVGFALKCATGDEGARAVAFAAVLERWFPGLIPGDALAERAIVRNVVGKPVGARELRWS